MKDSRLRRKLFGKFSEDCLNLYAHPCYTDKTRGFVGQTVDEINRLKSLNKTLQNVVYGMNDDIQALKDALEKKSSKKTSKKRR